MKLEVEDLLRLAEWLRWRSECAAAEARRLQAQEREAAVVDALDLYEGALWTRASALAFELSRYASSAWAREGDITSLPESAPPKRRAWHRVLRSRDGETIGDRQIYNIVRRLKSSGVAISTPPMSDSIRS